MKWTKRITTLVVILILSSTAFTFLANRGLKEMYGGLTEQVNFKLFQPQEAPIVIRNVNVLSPGGEGFISNQTVVIENGLITSVQERPQGAGQRHSINGEGKFLIPGLTDSHVHLFKSPNDLLLYIANGVTQIREMIGEKDHLSWRQEIQNGRIGPEIFIASPRIGSFEPLEGAFMSWSQGFLNIVDAAEAEQAVNNLHRQGYDAVKIYSQINKDTYYTVTETAKTLGMKVVGHVPWSVDMADIYPNQNEIAHLEELMNAMRREFARFTFGSNAELATEFLAFVERRSDEIANELLTNDIVVTTTLWLVESFVKQKFELAKVLKAVELEYENPGISEWTTMVPDGGLGWLPDVNRYAVHIEETEAEKAARRRFWETYAKACQVIVKSLVKRGVKVMAGTDANLPPAVPGFSLHDELASLHRAGMSPAQVLRSATTQPAEWLNNNSGKILPGRKANLVLLEKNPLVDISNTRTINSVIVNGRLLDRTQLDEILASVKRANDASRKKDISEWLSQEKI